MTMVTQPKFGSSSFKAVVKGLVALHRLIKKGKDESTEAEDVRDALEAPLRALSRTEKDRAQWLSEDLYSVSEPAAASTLKQMTPEAQRGLNGAIEARQDGKWDRALELLRRWQEHISPALLSYVRARIWSEAGYPEVAAEFFGHAAEFEPGNADYLALYIDALAQSDPASAQRIAGDVLADATKHAPVVVAEAADIRFQQIKNASDTESAEVCRELVPILERNLARIESEGESARHSPEHELTVAKLGMCHELLGNAGAAAEYFSRGLQANPNNDGLLVARGILLYGASPRSVGDFEHAVSLGSRLVWPYLFLAHHYLSTSRFEECRLMCEVGSRLSGSDAVKSLLEEWRAIAIAQLGFPADMVLVAFEAAVRLDPSNERAKRNARAFEAALRASHATRRTNWEQESPMALRRFGMAERRYALSA